MRRPQEQGFRDRMYYATRQSIRVRNTSIFSIDYRQTSIFAWGGWWPVFQTDQDW